MGRARGATCVKASGEPTPTAVERIAQIMGNNGQEYAP
jgi:hypothetical protein